MFNNPEMIQRGKPLTIIPRPLNKLFKLRMKVPLFPILSTSLSMHSFTSSFESLSDAHTSPFLSSHSLALISFPYLTLLILILSLFISPFIILHFHSSLSLTFTPQEHHHLAVDEPPSPPPGCHNLKPRPFLIFLTLTPLILYLPSPTPSPEHRATTTSTPANHLSSPLSFPVTSSPCLRTLDLHSPHPSRTLGTHRFPDEEIDRQVPLMDEIDNKVDRANADLTKTNVTLNFCFDITLLILILGIATYLYKERDECDDLITRVDAICKKYDKYDIDKQKELNNISGDDGFARLYGAIEADLDAALQKSEMVSTERNRATAVAMNAEIRRTKARLLEELPKLRRLAPKKVKGLSKEDLEARSELVFVLKERIEGIPDGSTTAAKQTGGWTDSAPYAGIKIDSNSDRRSDNEYFQQTEESDRFRQEYEMRRMKQDQGLDVIAEGLDTLKNMASDMNEEIDRQVPLMDEIDDKVDRANADLKNTNVRLKDTIVKLRSSRNFCIDITLLILILGIAAYLYNVLK